MSNCKKNCFSFVLFFSFLFFPCFALIPNSTVQSPSQGTWANPQPLIIDTQPGTEVYYSLNGEDPLLFGFAYDGPVMLEGYGDFTLQVVTVSPKGNSAITKIEWTVTERPPLNYIPLQSDSAFIAIEKDVSIDIPSNDSWFTGLSESSILQDDFFINGEKVSLYSNCDIVRYIPLIIKSDSDYYRYILRTGSTDTLKYSSPVPHETDIQFFSWNYVRLSDGKKVNYSIDGGRLQQTSSLISIDRSKDHTIKWNVIGSSDPEKTFTIPAKPALKGVPEKGFTNDFVKLYLDNPEYQFGYTSPDGNTLYSNTFFVDTVNGDIATISTNLDVYYRGIKQGSLPVAFLIDRRPPLKPIIKTSAKENFSRESVIITFDTSDTVYYSISSTKDIEKSYGANKSNAKTVINNSDYNLLTSNSIILMPNPNNASIYTVYAYSKDSAGNCSDIASYSVLIDSHDFYVDSNTTAENRIGTKDAPYKTLAEAVASIPSYNFVLHLNGDFEINEPVNVLANCKIIANGKSKLTFNSNAQLKFQNVNVEIENCILEKYVPQTGDVMQKNLLQIYDSNFVANNCDFICNFDFSGSVITAKNSTIQIEDSNLSSVALSYASIFNIEDTNLLLKNISGVSTAKTAVGISATKNVCTIDNANFKINGSLIRAVELTGVVLNVQNSLFEGQSSNSLKPAIWMDSYSTKNIDFENNFAGFSVLSYSE